MPVTVIVGGQFGSEGKGKVSYYFARKLKAAAVVRVGGTNSGHTVIADDGVEKVFRMLPTAAVSRDFLSILPSGAYIELEILFREIESAKLPIGNLKIDPYAVIIDEKMIQQEKNLKLREKIGSTSSGTGAAVVARITRSDNLTFAKEIKELKPFICETKALMRDMLNADKHIIIEGTQGFGLSPINSTYYPYCTSRDTTAASFVAEAGLSPLDVESIVMVIRAYPIRVAGNSGSLPKETDWDAVTKAANADCKLIEYTSATQRLRRVAEFDAEIVKRAIQVNRPNILVMNHLDYIDYRCHNTKNLSSSIKSFINEKVVAIEQRIDFIGCGKSILIENRGR